MHMHVICRCRAPPSCHFQKVLCAWTHKLGPRPFHGGGMKERSYRVKITLEGYEEGGV